MRRWLILALAVAGLLALAACAAKEETTPAPAASTPEAKAPWEQEWDRVIAAAKQEGKVTLVATSVGALGREAMTEPFQKKYGIQVELLTGTGAELAGRVKTERLAGKYGWDVYMSGMDTMFGLRDEVQAFDPLEPALILPEVKEPKNWLGGKMWFSENENKMLVLVTYSTSALWVNTDLVKAGEIKAWKDLLDPKWKGKIVADDPRVSGPGPTTFAFLYQQKELGPDFIRELDKQEIKFFRSYQEPFDSLAHGKASVLIGGAEMLAVPMIEQGLPIKMVDPRQLKEGGRLELANAVLALVNKAPHPNAARVYINWLLSKEGQTYFSKSQGYPSRRVDVPTDHLTPAYLPVEGYWANLTEEAVRFKRGTVMPFVTQVLGN